MTLESRLKAKAADLGFALAGITSAQPPESYAHFQSWLEKGMAGEMHYLAKGANARRDLNAILPGVRSVVMLAMNYCHKLPSDGALDREPSTTGRIAQYAQSADYHHVLWKKLDELLGWLKSVMPDAQGRGVVDSAPILERDLARRAGLGWFGKNTMIIHPHLGSYFFLAALLVTIPLHSDPPFDTDHCGTCTACLDACPTQAFPVPGQLDARRCISYLTIELRRAIPQELRSQMGDWVFGCDVCQEVCPWNHKAPLVHEPALIPLPQLQTPKAQEWLTTPADTLKRDLSPTPLFRPKRAGLLRNVCMVLGNQKQIGALPFLTKALFDEEPLIRGAAAWALGQFNDQHSIEPLTRALQTECDPHARSEIEVAIEKLSTSVIADSPS